MDIMTKFKDPVCQRCSHKRCRTPCAPLVWIDGRVPRQERLSRDLFTENNIAEKDYNEVLAERITDYNNKIDKIKDIPDKTTRAIAALIAVKLTKKDISEIFHISYRHFFRINKKAGRFIRQNKKLSTLAN